MAYGNLPGGGFSGFLKSKKPLPIERRSYTPLKNDDIYEEEFSDPTQPLLQSDRKKHESLIDKQDPIKVADESVKSKEKLKKEKKHTKVRKKVTFDERVSGNQEKKAKSKHTPKITEEISEKEHLEKDGGSTKKVLYGKGDKKQNVGLKHVSSEKAVEKASPMSEKSPPDELKFDKDGTKQNVSKSDKKASKVPLKKKDIVRMRVSTGNKHREVYSKIITKKKTRGQQEIKSLDEKFPKRISKIAPKKKTANEKFFRDDEYSADDSNIIPNDGEAEIKEGKESEIRDIKSIEDGEPKLILQKKDKKQDVGHKLKESEFAHAEDEADTEKEMEEEMIKKEDTEEISDLKKPEDKIIFFPEDMDHLPDSASEEKKSFTKFRRRRKIPTYTYYKRRRSILRFCPCLDRLLHSRRTEYHGLKAMFGFPVGALFGFALYWIVLERIGADPYYFWLLGMLVGAGFALSTQIRCICLLCIPTCCGRVGRAFVSTYTVAYVIEGPFTNILANSKEAMRSISCTASLNLNHSIERFRLMFKPVKEIVLDFVGAGEKVQKDAKQLEKTHSVIDNEVRDENEVREAMADVDELDKEIGGESRINTIKKKFKKKRKPAFGEDSEKKYGMKSELRCEEVFTKGVRACYDSFSSAYDRCHSYLPIIGYLLCWPMKLTFICDLASSLMGKRTCNSDAVLNPGFGASVDTADAVEKELDKDFAVQLQYKHKRPKRLLYTCFGFKFRNLLQEQNNMHTAIAELIIPEERVDQLVPEDISETMKYSFERRKKNLDFFTQLVDRILAVLCLLVLNSSRMYCNKYLRAIQFDNKYITSYFRHIDARRRKAGKMVLLPLKKLERLELFDPFSVRFSADEKMPLIIGGLRVVSEVLTVTVLLMFDRIFYELLDIIQRNAHVTYKQTGIHHIKMTIYGDGFVGNMVRGILKGFDKKHSLDEVTTTEGCLPLPTKLPRCMITRLYLVFLLVLLLMILESYALKLRRVICAFFYPKREKRRIIFLYNDRLKKRNSFLKHMRHRVRKQAREKAIAIDGGVFFTLRKFYPRYFGWISKLGLGLAQCLICSDGESKSCRLIACPECPFSYCSECWQGTEGKCYACLPDYDTEPSDTTSDED